MKMFFIMSIGLTTFVSAADIEAGKTKSMMCTGCHGQNGISMIPSYPNLAGQKARYLEIQMRAYRSGSRPNPIMKPIVSSLTNEDIANLAAYYKSLGKSK